MGIYEQGTSNEHAQPVMGHPVYPPPNAPAYHQHETNGVVPTSGPGRNGAPWASKLCGCCSDCDICCQTCWCPCVTFGQIAEIVDEGQTPCCAQGTIYGALCSVGIPCVYSFRYRQKLRLKFGLEKGACGDFCVHCCCGLCALCQEHRELQSRGLDPSLGWEIAQQNLVRPMAVPTSPGGMYR